MLKGEVSKILYNSGSNKLISLYVKDISGIDTDMINPQYPNNITVAGTLQGVNEGYIISVEGNWSMSKKAGNYWPWQFKVSKTTILDAETPESIIKFLSTLPNVGTATAEKIYAVYGKDIFSVLENNPFDIASKISGITPDKAKEIGDAYKEKTIITALTNFLSPYNVSENKIKKIKDELKSDAVNVIKGNPYILANSKIVSFKTSDNIAKDLGFECLDHHRIEGALTNVLDIRASSLGHTYLKQADAVNETVKLLQTASCIKGTVSPIHIQRQLTDFIEAGQIIDDSGNIYLKYRYANELNAAKALAHRSKLKGKFSDVDDTMIQKCVKKAEDKLHVTLAEKQREAVVVSIKNTTTIVTGGPGTGKTTTLKAMMLSMDYLCEELGLPEREKKLAAPTGMAAKRMKEATERDASTIHRLLEFTPYAGGEVKSKNAEDPIICDVLIVDESSMLDIDLFSMLIGAIQDRTSVVFVGDIDQLPSVGPGNVLHDIIDSGVIPVVRLNQTYRQGKESPILANALKINKGESDLIFDKPNDFKFIEIPDNPNDPECREMCEMTKRVFYEEFQLCGGDISKIQVLLPMRKKTLVSVDMINPELQDTVNSCVSQNVQMQYGMSFFRKGDKVMQLTNNYDKWVFNGDVGIVTRVSPSNSKLLVNFGGEDVEYQKDELEQLRLSYATTIHKSQGSEYKTVIIVLTNQHKLMLQRNLLYTGLTRAKKKAIIIGDRNALNYAISNTTNRQRNSMLKEKLIKFAGTDC